jgi:hypothetical protein
VEKKRVEETRVEETRAEETRVKECTGWRVDGGGEGIVDKGREWWVEKGG